MKGYTPAEQNHANIKSHIGRDCHADVYYLIREVLHFHNYLYLEQKRLLVDNNQRLEY